MIPATSQPRARRRKRRRRHRARFSAPTSDGSSSGAGAEAEPAGCRDACERRSRSCIVPRAMRIGVAREIKQREYRVALDAGRSARARPARPRGDRRAGRRAWARASPTRPTSRSGRGIAPVDDVWASAELLLKVKEPIAEEYGRLREGLTLFTYLHIAADEPLTRALVDSGITGDRLRDRREGRPPAAAARADERGGRPARAADGRVVAREGARRPRHPARRRARACRRRRS